MFFRRVSCGFVLVVVVVVVVLAVVLRVFETRGVFPVPAGVREAEGGDARVRAEA